MTPVRHPVALTGKIVLCTDRFMFREPAMNPAHDALSRIHQFQAQRCGQSALPYDQFSARLRGPSDTDLTGLLLPPTEVRIEIRATREPKFSLGQLCITPQAVTAVPPDEVLKAVARHTSGDWGMLDEHDRQENARAALHGGRLVAASPRRESAHDASCGLHPWMKAFATNRAAGQLGIYVGILDGPPPRSNR